MSKNEKLISVRCRICNRPIRIRPGQSQVCWRPACKRKARAKDSDD